MRLKVLKFVVLAAIGLSAAGCSKCGGFERVYLPYESGVCTDRAASPSR